MLKVDWEVKLDIELTFLHFGQRVTACSRVIIGLKKSTAVLTQENWVTNALQFHLRVKDNYNQF